MEIRIHKYIIGFDLIRRLKVFSPFVCANRSMWMSEETDNMHFFFIFSSAHLETSIVCKLSMAKIAKKSKNCILLS